MTSAAYDISKLSQRKIKAQIPLQIYFARKDGSVDPEQPAFMIAQGEEVVISSPRKRPFGTNWRTMLDVEGIEGGYVLLTDLDPKSLK